MTDSAPTKRYGKIGMAERQAMSGLEFVQGLADGALPLNTMARTMGYDIVEVAPQYDANHNTAHVGAQILFEILSLMVYSPAIKAR